MAWVFHAQRALTLDWLHHELPLNLETLRWDLSGPGSLRATIAPELAQLIAPDGQLLLDEWSTLIYAEVNEQIQWGGILVSSEFVGGQWTIEAAGFSSYPHGIPYGDAYKHKQVHVMSVIAHLWDHVQDSPDGDLGVEVITDPCPAILGTLKEPDTTEYEIKGVWTTDKTGFVKSASAALAKSVLKSDTTVTITKIDNFATLTPPYKVSIGNEDLTVTARSGLKLTVTRGLGSTDATGHNKGVKVTFEGTATRVTEGAAAEPYTLSWWEAPDCGSELDTLTSEAPLDYVEQHSWITDDTGGDDLVQHQILYRYPRAGSKRKDLAFRIGDNVSDVVTITQSGDDFANDVIGLGKGEGAKMVRATSAVRDGRLRRCFVVTDKTASRTATMQAKARKALAKHNLLPTITSLTVRDHPNAPMGSWELGDDVLVNGNVPWLGDVSIWSRITGWELLSDSTARLTLERSDSFTYGAPVPATKPDPPVESPTPSTGLPVGPHIATVDPTHLVTLEHLPKGMRTSLLSAAGRDPLTGDLFEAQEVKGNTWIHRHNANGDYLSSMCCKDGGHGSTIAVERSGSEVMIWLNWDTRNARRQITGRSLARIKYEPATRYRRSAQIIDTGHSGNYVLAAVDQANDVVMLRVLTGGNEVLETHRMSKLLAGKHTPISTVINTGNSDDYVFQGMTVYGRSGYKITGETTGKADYVAGKENPIYLWEYDLLTGNQVTKKNVTDAGRLSGDPLLSSEPEGVFIAAIGGGPVALYTVWKMGSGNRGEKDERRIRIMRMATL